MNTVFQHRTIIIIELYNVNTVTPHLKGNSLITTRLQHKDTATSAKCEHIQCKWIT